MTTVGAKKMRELKIKVEKDIQEKLQDFMDKTGLDIKNIFVYSGQMPVLGKGTIKKINVFIETKEARHAAKKAG